ncbi:MAG: hypothetical protein ACK4IB_06425 [Erythrobacter sp.]
MTRKGRKLFGLNVDLNPETGEAGDLPDPAPATRAEGIQRLQVGLFGIAAMVLLVGLASIIGSQADLADEAAVPDAAPTTEPRANDPSRNSSSDPVVVPDIPAEPSPAPLLDPLVLPPPTSSPAANPGASPKP